ncbi:hypothetical protein BP6252_07394 [Coleophoma cylindrospora]|uniref:Pre-rRNA-processing protein RIX1 n=1 Tax=Coleophoma cylindrospora TaxID=1849047 RepID=A0A3D8RHH6_9HELO|nr:hypothetical protein BP6252_07394 [Coleophoma cylindrospora]
MSLPPELRLLCLQLSSTPTEQLPRLTPVLLRHVLRCQGPLSSSGNNAAKSDASASSVLVHKLKTQLSTLLNGRSTEGRFAAVVLIKGVVEVGGWEVLRGSEPWIRGLLSILKKPDPEATKELCVVTLTKIYCMTHQYQTLVRELTTPTLPAFITECVALLPARSSGKALDTSQSLIEAIFRSFAVLIPRHSTIFRSFAGVIRSRAKPFLAPTYSDGYFVSSSVIESARCASVALHHTVAKNAGGDEWARFVREYVKHVHITADQVFRAVVEDWESTTGYISSPVDVNQELSGGSEVDDPSQFPRWDGIDAGIQRLIGLLGLLEEYLKSETPAQVSVPLGLLLDMTTRMLSIIIPTMTPTGTEQGGSRLHPAIGREERDGLWSGLPQVYVAALGLISAMLDRFESKFMSLASGSLDQLLWMFPSGRAYPEFRTAAYSLMTNLLPLIGGGLSRPTVVKMAPAMRLCCKDLQPDSQSSGNNNNGSESSGGKSNIAGMNMNADALLQNGVGNASQPIQDPALVAAASALLPVLLSHVPQQNIDLSLRALLDRTAILSQNKDAMLSSIVHPFIGKNGNGIPSILPHFARAFSHDNTVEVLLRPRMPVVPSSKVVEHLDETAEFREEEEETTMDTSDKPVNQELPMVFETERNAENTATTGTTTGTTTSQKMVENHSWFGGASSGVATTITPTGSAFTSVSEMVEPIQASEKVPASGPNEDVNMGEDSESDSDDESVHLTMQLDEMSDSE